MVKRMAKGRRRLLTLILACAFAGQGAMAQSTAAANDTSALDAFRDICIRSGAQTSAVLDAGRSLGFSAVASVPTSSRGMTNVVALERGTGETKLVIVVSTGFSRVTKSLSAEVPVRSCALSGKTVTADLRGFARSFAGVAPQFDADGVAAYLYLERAKGNIVAPEEDLPALINAVNAGELRTLAIQESANARSIAYVIFEVPTNALISPTALTALHDSDPFAPCKWETPAKPKKAARRLVCPTAGGSFRQAFVKGVTEETPTQARSGDAAAMTALALFYFGGPEPARDPVSAFAWFKRSAEAGAPTGAFNLGLAYDDGVGIAADKGQAEQWYRKAIAQQSLSAKVNLAALLLKKADGNAAAQTSEASALIRQASDAGSIEAMFNMGHLFENGIGQAKSMTEALRWYRLGSDAKDARSMLRLGLIYADGLGGVAKDEAEAAGWFVKAVEPVLGLVSTLFRIEASIYRVEDPKRRAALTTAAAKDPVSALKIGVFLADKTNKDRDPVEAIRLLQIAADARLPIAALRLGVMYAEGDGVSKSNSEAIKLFRTDGRIRTLDTLQRVTSFAEKP